MSPEAFRIARGALRLAVKEYGYRRKRSIWHGEGRSITRTSYCASPGKFEGEHWCVPYFYNAVLDGGTDEPLYDGDTVAADLLPVSDDKRAAFGFAADTTFVALWYSDSGFVHLDELTAEQYDELRDAYSDEGGDNE